jgi:predicted aminopeptidase
VAGVGAAAVLLAAACVLGGCGMLGYYGQAVTGHVDLMQRSRPVDDWIGDGATPEALRERLALARSIRAFAVRELALPDNASYSRFAELQRGAAVWNVVAAPELSLQLKTWCFPVTGCVGYRGYFDREAAQQLAGELEREGWEVHVYGVPAYSTLGWTNWLGGDPILSTFIHWPEGELARLLFHELAHQVAYAGDDTTFNESFAVAVERIGVERWLAQPGKGRARREYLELESRKQDFRRLTATHRARLHELYAGAASVEDKRRGKAELAERLRAEVAQLKAGPWAGFSGYDAWFAKANNAAFGVQAAYAELVPDFERLFEREGRDFDRFYAEVKRLAALPKAERRATLAARR